MDKEAKEHECIGFRRDFIRENHSPQESNLKENDDFLDVIKNTPVDTSSLSDKREILKDEMESMGINKGYITRILWFIEVQDKEFIKKLKQKLRDECDYYIQQNEIIDKLAGDELI